MGGTTRTTRRRRKTKWQGVNSEVRRVAGRLAVARLFATKNGSRSSRARGPSAAGGARARLGGGEGLGASREGDTTTRVMSTTMPPSRARSGPGAASRHREEEEEECLSEGAGGRGLQRVGIDGMPASQDDDV